MAITNYSVSLGLKLPIPTIQYGMHQLMVSVSGDNIEEVKEEARAQLDILTEEMVRRYEQDEE